MLGRGFTGAMAPLKSGVSDFATIFAPKTFTDVYYMIPKSCVISYSNLDVIQNEIYQMFFNT
jgi:hypothetical protein